MPGVVSSASATMVDVSPYIAAIFEAKTSQESLDGAVALCKQILANPESAHHVLADVLPHAAKAAADKKSGNYRESAMIIYGALYETLPLKAPITEAFLVEDTMGNVFDGLADKGAVVRESAQYAIDAIIGILGQPALVSGLLGAVERYLGTSNAKWQGKVGALQVIGKLAEKALKAYVDQGEVFLKDVLGRELEGLIPVVESGMHDMKNEVWSLFRFSRVDCTC